MQNDTTVGATLKATRESLGLTVRDMADITRIQPVWLECIEQDRYSEMPAEVFIRGFIRSYARELRLCEETVFEAYMAQTGQNRQEALIPVVNQQTLARTAFAHRIASRSPNRMVYVGALAACVALLAGAILAFSGSSEPDAAAANFRVNDTTDAWQPALDGSSDWRRR